MKIIIAGRDRSGKDTVCTMLHKAIPDVLRYVKTSTVYFKILSKELSIPVEELQGFDKESNRQLWYDTILLYNRRTKGGLPREVFKQGDIYTGLRTTQELEYIASFDANSILVFLDPLDRVPPSPLFEEKEMKERADVIITTHDMEVTKKLVYDFACKLQNIYYKILIVESSIIKHEEF